MSLMNLVKSKCLNEFVIKINRMDMESRCWITRAFALLSVLKFCVNSDRKHSINVVVEAFSCVLFSLF